MKPVYFLAILCPLLAACAGKLPEKVEYPHYAFRNVNSQELVSVERTGTATILSFKAFGNPHFWIRVAKEAFLTDGSERYALIGAEGIRPGERLNLDDNGNAEYKLFFEPIPSKLRKISYIESEEGERAFNFYHIDLSGNNTSLIEAPSVYPEFLPVVDLKVGVSTLTVNLPGSMKGLPPVNVRLTVNDFFPMDQKEFQGEITDDEGITFTFEQHGPALCKFYVGVQGRGSANILINPGETVTATFDASGRDLTIERFMLDETPAPTGVYTGKFAALNNLAVISDPDYDFRVFPREFATDAATISDYAAVVKDTYNEKMASLAADESRPPFQKEYLKYYIASEAADAMSIANYIRQMQYYDAHDGGKGYVNESFAPEDLAFLKDLDLNDPGMLLMGRLAILRNPLSGVVFPGKEGLQAEYRMASEIGKKVQDGLVPDDKDMAVLDDLSTPFYKECILSMVAANEQQLLAFPECVKDVPDVSSDKLLDAILKNYRGKTVLVDFWGTWCEPCRRAHEVLEPMKDKRFKDISFVYITDPSSPIPKWLEMIEKIKGDHYYLTDEQFKTIYKQLEADAVPTYLIVDKDGKIQKKAEGFSSDVLDALEKAQKL